MRTRLRGFGLLVAVAVLAAGCAAGKAFRQGEIAMKTGDLDQAVSFYRSAVQAAPDNPRYKIALQRAMQAASRSHLEKAQQFEEKDQLEAALGEYKQASELDPSNRQAAAKVAALDRTIRDRIEAARPKPPIQQMRERARAASAEPVLNPASREPLNIRFNNAGIRDILNFIANATGINVMYDREFTDRPSTVQLDGVTLEQALSQILTTSQLSYKIINDRSIFVFPDTPPKHAQYDEQVVRTFYISHADATELSQILSTIIRLPGIAIQPAIVANKTANTITVRATTPVVQILERMIEQNDKPRAEIVFDVEILEVDRTRAKQYGLNLSDYALGGIFSPETAPNTSTTTPTGGTGTTTSSNSTPPTGVKSPPAFNLNTISKGISTADFYLAVPTAVVKFLESDNHTKLVAKPQLRGAEGTKLTLNLGTEVPIVSTSYTPIATGGVGVNPLNSFQLKPVGINIDITPRVTLEGDILMDLNVESSTQGPDVNVAGTNYPSFGSRKVSTRLRLRDGESNLLAGLLREDESTTVQGFPGAIRLPLFKQLFSGNVQNSTQTDIVMLLTPHIVRTHEITEADLRPIYIGSQGAAGGGLGVGGPPPLIAPLAPAAAETTGGATPSASAPVSPSAAPGARPTTGVPSGSGGTSPPTTTSLSGAVVSAPPGSSPVPGTVLAPQPSPVPTPNIVDATPPQQTAPAATAPPAPQPAATPGAQTPPTPSEPPITAPGVGSAQVTLSPPGTTFRVGGGPYTVPISVSGATRLSTLTLTLTFDPTRIRVRTVQEGSFMRQGGVPVAFNQQVNGGRVDITIARGADATGASGTGLLAALILDAVGPGSATLTLSGAATGPGGTPMGLQFRPVTVTVAQ